MDYIVVDDLKVYKDAVEIAEVIYKSVMQFPGFDRYSLGKQLMESADSIAANISEGHGRYFYKENRNFCYYARGSLLETKTWLTKSKNRNLISEDEFSKLIQDLNTLHYNLNMYIKSIGSTSK
jgi:four helix bundle protein